MRMCEKKTRMMGLSGRERSFTIFSVLWIQYTGVTDGQTDGHRPTASTALTHSGAPHPDYAVAIMQWRGRG